MSKSKCVLVVRRDESSLRKVVEALERRGLRATSAADPGEALEAASGKRFDLVVAEAVLPGRSGFELLSELAHRSEPRRPPLAIVLEAEDRYGRGRARAEGIDLVLVDPLEEDDFDRLADLARHPDEAVDGVLRVAPSKKDRFLRELLRGTQSRSESVAQRVADPLTGLHHKEFVALELEEEFKRARRYGHPLAVLVVDLDNYDEAKVSHGKALAQEMLLEAAGVFLCESRDVDRAGRVGEARFLLILPDTDLAGARVMADRVFQQVCSRTLHARGEDVPIRASVGIAALPSQDVASVEDFLERALKALRTARNLGGNRICAWGDPQTVSGAEG